MTTGNEQSPASAVLMLEGLAWALERLPAPSDPLDARARALTVRAVRDAARAAVDQHHDWTAQQLAVARDSSGGAWNRELLRALLGSDISSFILRHPSHPAPTDQPHE